MRNQATGSPSGEAWTPSPMNVHPVGSPRNDQPSELRNRQSTVPTAKQGSADTSKPFDHREVSRKLKQDYAHGARDPSIRQLDTLHALIKFLMKADPNLDEMLEQTARMIYTQFNIKEVSVGLRSATDGLYRYVAEHGMRTDIWAAHKKITYTYDDLNDPKKYRPITISHQTKLFLAEDDPYGPGESNTYSEHMMRQSKRKSATDSIEGDYIDIYIFGPQDETYGWIEISGTWDGRIPDARSIRCLEMISSVLGIAIARHAIMEDLAKSTKATDLPKKL